MNSPPPTFQAPLDPEFQPAILWRRKFKEMVEASGDPAPCNIALEQADGSIFHHETRLLPASHPEVESNFRHVERLIKFLLWSRGGWRVHLSGPIGLAARLHSHFQDTATGRFDSNLIGEKVYGQAIEVLPTREIPAEQSAAQPMGRHLDGCRIGFDLGGSDRKVAAVIDGEVVFSEETVWDPYHKSDPQYHLDGILESLRTAAKHLPQVNAIGGSAAGVYVNNEVKVASLFRGIPDDLFESNVRHIFREVGKSMGDHPLVVVNDGEVTALAGSMSLGRNSVLGIAMGTSLASGYVNPNGNITTGLNELAFAPVDYRADAPADEWSGDLGCGVQYFSQQAVGRLLKPAGIDLPEDLGLPGKLKEVQSLMEKEDPRARKIYETLGIYLGYTLPHYADFYAMENVLLLGRVTSGSGGDLLLQKANEVLDSEFPELAEKLNFHIPDEKEKRHGQAIAAASLPSLRRQA
ncbi:MAG: ROK family protein [Opitutales bacterium]|nr:ROK family protein [Opitutales bacterium]